MLTSFTYWAPLSCVATLMMTTALAVLSTGLSASLSASESAVDPDHAQPSLRSEDPAIRAYWYDQGAEISSYDLNQSRYGQQHQGHAVMIYVTEPIDTVGQVKSDNPNAETTIPGLKLNATRRFLTGIYPLHRAANHTAAIK